MTEREATDEHGAVESWKAHLHDTHADHFITVFVKTLVAPDSIIWQGRVFLQFDDQYYRYKEITSAVAFPSLTPSP